MNINTRPKDYDPANPYEWHDNAMKGVIGPIHSEEPQTGWYWSVQMMSQLSGSGKLWRQVSHHGTALSQYSNATHCRRRPGAPP